MVASVAKNGWMHTLEPVRLQCSVLFRNVVCHVRMRDKSVASTVALRDAGRTTAEA